MNEKALSFINELRTSDDTRIQKSASLFEDMLSGVSGKTERGILLASTPHMRVVNESEKQLFYNTYGQQNPSAEYQIVVNIHEE